MASKLPPFRSEASRIADQLRRAFEGDAWHGPALLEILKDVDAATAAARPLAKVHSIWELVLHVAAWDEAVRRRIGGQKLQLKAQQNFPQVTDTSSAAWRKAIEHVKKIHDALVKTVAALPDARLGDRVPGKLYNFHFMLDGLVQHELYHAGQIAILKKAPRSK